jgi:anti-sigma28 factor (negative regulator of flagellin synthesis)
MATGEDAITKSNAENAEPERSLPEQTPSEQCVSINPSESINPAPQCWPNSTDPNSQSDEVSGNREQKLERIREAVASGYYDSEELLELAMTRMIERLKNSP